MEIRNTEGLALEELEAQQVELLPDRDIGPLYLYKI